MRSNTIRFLAVLLAMLLCSATFVCTGVFATGTDPGTENANGSINIYRMDAGTTVTVDGAVGDTELWDLIPWSSPFVVAASAGTDETHPVQETFSARMKLMWQKDGDRAYLYILVEVADQTLGGTSNHWTADSFNLLIDEDGDGKKDLNTPALYVPSRECTYENQERFTYKIDDRRAEADGYTLEACYTFADAANCTGNLAFDVILTDNIMKDASDGTRYVRYSWRGTVDNGKYPNGTCAISEKKVSELQGTEDDANVILKKGPLVVDTLTASAEGTVVLPECESKDLFLGWSDNSGNLYPVGYTLSVGEEQITLQAVIVAWHTVTGASVRMESPLSIRFAIAFTSGYDAAKPFLTGYGLLLADADALTQEILSDGQITEEALRNAGVGFEKTTGSDTEVVGTEVRCYGVREDLPSAQTAVAAGGYLTVRYADETSRTFYTAFVAEKHIRTAEEVAEKAYADRSNLSTTTGTVRYCFKVSSRYALEDYPVFSYSPYTADQLDFLKTLFSLSGTHPNADPES